MKRPARVLWVVAAAACGHGDAWVREPVAPNVPRGPEPQQISFSPEGDWSPVWLPDGSAFGYSYEPLDRRDRDRCLGIVPASGGRVQRSICIRGQREWDTTNVVTFHAVSAEGTLAIVAEHGNPLSYVPDTRYLYLGPLDGSRPLNTTLNFPRLSASGQIHYTPNYLTWVGESTLVFLATLLQYYPGAFGIPPDTVLHGIEIVKLGIAGDAVTSYQIIPGTLGVSSLTNGTRPGAIAFTRGGSSMVFELDLATGATDTIYDFGGLGLARDVQIAAGKLVAIVGGRVVFTGFDAVFGVPVQADSGGPVYAAHLPGGPPLLVVSTPDELMYRRPALEPSGLRVIVEAFGYEFKNIGGELREVVSKQADLWMFPVP